MNKTPPFYANPTNEHCWQACLRMVLEHFEPEKTWTWEELDEFSAKPKDMGTYPTTSLNKIANMNYNIQLYGSRFDYESMGNDLVAHFEKMHSGKDLEWILNNTVIDVEEASAQELQSFINQDKVTLIKKDADASNFKELLNDGYVCIVWVNSLILYQEEGFVGHFIVAYASSENKISIHDPGYIGKKKQYSNPEQHVDLPQLLKAATNNGKCSTGVYAFKKKEN